MAITNARMQIKRGNEVDFDAEKMLVGEWALSTDKRIVRICVAPNVCIRMATYDAFEVDMAQIDKILEECRTIEDVVKLINSQVSEKLELTIEYTNQAKQYRDETEQFRNEVESMVDIGIATTEKAGIVKPDGTTIRVDEDGTIHADNGTVDYNELENKPSINGMELSGDKSLDELGIASVEALEETNYKVDTILEKAGLTLKNTASGSPIHLTDSANGKAVSFGLYGKAEQKQYSGKNLLENTAKNQTGNGVTFTVNADGSVTVVGTATSPVYFGIGQFVPTVGETYILSGYPVVGSQTTHMLYWNTNSTTVSDIGSGATVKITNNTTKNNQVLIVVFGGQTVNFTVKPMIRLASITDSTYEPYTNGASPNPDYPQDIEVAGASGSVEVKSVGKNLIHGIDQTWTPTEQTDKPISESVHLKVGEYTLSWEQSSTLTGNVTRNTATFGKTSNYTGTKQYHDTTPRRNLSAGRYFWVLTIKEEDDYTFGYWMHTAGVDVTISNIQLEIGSTMTEYEPYTETISTIPTPDGLCGIKVSSGGNYTDENGQQWLCDEVVKYADGSGKRVQRIKKILLSTVSNWYHTMDWGNPSAFVAENLLLDAVSVSGFGIIANIMCNRLQIVKPSSIASGSFVGSSGIGQGSEKNLFVAIDGITTFDGLISYFAENETVLYYPLSEPIITDLSAEEIAEIEKLYTFYPVTNISNDADCGMSITYMADAKNYIDNRLALIESAMLNNI